MQTYELKKIPLFRTFSLEDLYIIAEKVSHIEYKTGEIVFNFNELADAFYIISEGSVEVIEPSEDGKDEVVLAVLNDGDYFGEMALLMEEPRTATVRAKSDTLLFKLLKSDFQQLLDRNQSMYKPIAYVLSRRLKEGNLQRLFEKQAYAHKYTPTGSLSDGALIEILKYCEDNALSGLVKIVRENETGVLRYERGGIVNIDLHDMNPDQALDTMLSWDSGTFTIEPKIFHFTYTPKAEEVESKPINEEEMSHSFNRSDLIGVVNLVVQYSVKLIGKTIVYNFLNRLQNKLVRDYQHLKIFQLAHTCDIDLREGVENRIASDKDIEAAAIWLKKMISECGKYEIKFESFDIRQATRQFASILEKLKFYQIYQSN
ncbi:MAG: cyclic nucleotide-binding domain-containing protein [Calditrichaeota bacterium]|nr:cyclic nucleotide-binding domain-containing protein [Calditrichota bacterium]